MASTSSVFHFFVRLVERRGYLVECEKFDDFDFPREMIAAESAYVFPDFVLRANAGSEYSGGEFIELKDANSYVISSFNSTIPTSTKPISVLSKAMLDKLRAIGETPEALPERDVFYLIRGIKKARSSSSSPLVKTVLVSGAFFHTLPVDQMLAGAFAQFAVDSALHGADASELADGIDVRQSNLSATRRVEGASISVRFRVMSQADPEANLLSPERYPMIGDNTLTLIVHDNELPADSDTTSQLAWNDAPALINSCDAYSRLGRAFDEIDPSLKSVIRVSIMRHPLNGPFFMAQASMHPA